MSSVRIHLEKNALPGYTLSLKQTERRQILSKLSKKLGWGNVVKKLNVLYIFNKNKHPETAAKFRKDMKYIQKQFSPKHKSPKQKSKARKSKKSKKSKARKSKKSSSM